MTTLTRRSLAGRSPMASFEQSRVGFIGSEGHVVPDGGEYLPVENPATGEVIASAYEGRAEDVDAVVRGAEDAFHTVWRRTTPDARGALLRRWAELVTREREALADLEVRDVGHLRKETLGDTDVTARILDYYGGMADKIEERSYSSYPDRVAYGRAEPYGVVGGISPYNANAIFTAFKAGPALAAGNCIVLKAPEVSPLVTYRLVELALEAGIPPGVVNVVTGRGQVVGPLVTEHPAIGMVAFTGGVEAGRAVIQQSAGNVVPLSLELGGKNPVIVLDDADLDLLIPSLLHSNFVKSGQSCAAGTRIFLPRSRNQEIADRMTQRAEQVRVGMPDDPESQMGTLISRRHRDRVHSLVNRARDAGAVCLVGGSPAQDGPLADGAFFQPTVLAEVKDDNPIATTEAFGPVASLLVYDDVDEALRRANDSQFGLSAQVWGNNARDIQHLVANLEVGTVWVNLYRGNHPTVPFGGMKQSGYARENAFEAIRLYTRQKSVVWDTSTERALPYQS
ncbi:aldehyde dehydrogenase family protein [Geodermatophilus sp. CPCC 205506]|uniref:aldehyde dehydrogenase family protein n=1 Tax=Geodermatophilus sp. CPCC 205506 TaxID=2936596 RepID=UPI003EE959B0